MTRHAWRPTLDWIASLLRALDAHLMRWPIAARCLVIGLTLLAMAWQGVRWVPRPGIDFSRWPALEHIPQPATYGTDTIADMYESKVVLNDVRDMYTKSKVDQTPEEARTWSKEESSPYPPALLLTEAGLYAIGQHTGIGFYGLMLAMAVLFLGLSLYYFAITRWYLFPLLYLNFDYLGQRFTYIQDGSYLVMLVVVMAALFMARRRLNATHVVMAVAITLKISPLYYATGLLRWRRPAAVLFVMVLVAGLVLPYFIWENYLYIYQFNAYNKGDWLEQLSGFAYAIPFSLVLSYVATRLQFDMEDQVGWGMIPFALFLAIRTNAPRHLLMALLVPDKRGYRNVVAAVAMAVPALLPGLVRFSSALSIATALLFLILLGFLDRIGWETVRNDFRHPLRTWRRIFTGDPLPAATAAAGR